MSQSEMASDRLTGPLCDVSPYIEACFGVETYLGIHDSSVRRNTNGIVGSK